MFWHSATFSESGGAWPSYYCNGHICNGHIYWGHTYPNDRNGLDILRIDDKRTDSAQQIRLGELNVQTRPRYR